MHAPLPFADAMAEAARAIAAPRDLQGTLDSIVQAARHSVPGVDHAGISVCRRRGTIETKAATDPLVLQLDQLQYELGDGPCLEAIWDEGVVLVEDARAELRWPRFMARAVALGLQSQLGLRLYVEGETLGGLNLYSSEAYSIDAESQHVAELFATHAALALGRVRREDDLNSALESRTVIGQALGIVMERHGVDEALAFQYLASLSQHSNTKLRDVAAELVRLCVEQSTPSSAPSAAHPLKG